MFPLVDNAGLLQRHEMGDYEDKIQREKGWYGDKDSHRGHFLNSRIFSSPERTDYNTRFVKARFAEAIQQVISADGLTNPKILIAPTGAGNDLPYLLPLSNQMAGVDISEEAVTRLDAPNMEKHVGDIKNMKMFADGTFDIVIMSQFFHHFLSFGFDEFVTEAKRVLKPGGRLFAFEPNIMHPMCFAACIGKKVFGNITGAVEDESPYFQPRLTSSMKRCGLESVWLRAASYSHNRMPIFLARIIHAVTRPLLNVPGVRLFGWYCTIHGRKPL